MQYTFGPFRADRSAYQVHRDGQVLPLTPKLLDLLFHLLEHSGSLVTKEQLLDEVWPGANVTENALARAVSELREALGDRAAAPTYIRTVARRGYRFVAPVERLESAPPTPPVTVRPPHQPSEGDRTIAVLDFANVTGEADVAWLAAGIAETVTSDLAAVGHFHVVDRWRVVDAVRRTGPAIRDLGNAVGATLVVAGSYQRRGSHLRITARMVDLGTGDAVADAKVDGALDDIFALEDGIVRAFSRDLGVALPEPAADGLPRSRETSNLEAYRAYTEGWLKIESLDTDLIRASIDDFERATRKDPGYAMAYTGLANAEFVAYEMTRASRQPDVAALTAGIEHARHAIRLDEHLAEAHATLSFLLASALSFDEARAAAERAVALEPGNWRHHYRLGHAAWGQARLRALDRALELYPGFAYAQFETAMLHIARGAREVAARLAEDGAAEQDRHARSANRFPAIGFHWLAGAVAAADGRPTTAVEHFDRELDHVDPRRLYGPEYGAATLVARGHVELALDQADRALASFRQALTHVPGHARAHLGEAVALERLGRPDEARGAWDAVRVGERVLARTDRAHEATLTAACRLALSGETTEAVRSLAQWLERLPSSSLGWNLPIEPCFRALRDRQDFQALLDRLADRAR